MSSDGTQALWNFDKAAAVFPLEYRIREGEAVVKAVYEGIPPHVAIQHIEAVRAADPHSPNLWFFLGAQRARLNDLPGLIEARATLESVIPGWRNIELLREAEARLAAAPDSAANTAGDLTTPAR